MASRTVHLLLLLVLVLYENSCSFLLLKNASKLPTRALGGTLSFVAKATFRCSHMARYDPQVLHKPLKATSQGENESPFRSSLTEASPDEDLAAYLQEVFQGDFDNYRQVVEDRRLGKLPREGGGHEHMHCTLVPLPVSSSSFIAERLAAFYFDGMPERIFRFRYYRIEQSSKQEDRLFMKLYTLHPALEGLLRKHSSDPLSWRRLFCDFDLPNDDEKIVYLPNCNVEWSPHPDQDLHFYYNPQRDPPGAHAVMVEGEAIVESQLIPGQRIRVVDQLTLLPNVFFIHDRGFDPETGNYVYGNQAGIPYKLDRVSNMVVDPDDSTNVTRNLIQDDDDDDIHLAWTLGDNYRTSKEYLDNMERIGGPSAVRNQPAKRSD